MKDYSKQDWSEEPADSDFLIGFLNAVIFMAVIALAFIALSGGL